uniref:Uncharacterized protein n=1 Tax=Anopheles atroparvus TaxID=41427 RepID=A0AAG5DWZ4_ANOAO
MPLYAPCREGVPGIDSTLRKPFVRPRLSLGASGRSPG